MGRGTVVAAAAAAAGGGGGVGGQVHMREALLWLPLVELRQVQLRGAWPPAQLLQSSKKGKKQQTSAITKVEAWSLPAIVCGR